LFLLPRSLHPHTCTDIAVAFLAVIPAGNLLAGVKIAAMVLHSNLTEAANRAEVTALLIRCGYLVYRPEADVAGEDLILRSPSPQREPIIVQLKSRPTVDRVRYLNKNIWMLFPDPTGPKPGREWFLIKHDVLFSWWERNHGHTESWKTGWSTKTIAGDLRLFLKESGSLLQPAMNGQKSH